MFNPFHGPVFSRAMERLVEAVDRRGRPLRVIYLNPKEHMRVMQTRRAVELPPPAGLRLRFAGIPRGWVRRCELRPWAERFDSVVVLGSLGDLVETVGLLACSLA
jgi:hypothetical protein